MYKPEDVERLQKAAQEMRDSAVSVLQDFLLPDSAVDAHDAINDLLGIFDGPKQRELDAALAAIKTKGTA